MTQIKASMQYRTRALLAAGFIVLTGSIAYSQRAPTQDEIDRAQLVLGRVLNSESDAEHHLLFLQSYIEQSPWQFRTVVDISQKLLSAHESLGDVQRAIVACGDAAVAASVEDDDLVFERITFALFAVRSERTVISALSELESAGIPVYDLLSAMTGLSPAKTRALAEAGRVNPKGTFQVLLDAFERKYQGLAAKRAEQLKKKR